MLAEQLKLLLTRVPFAVKIYELNLQQLLLLLLSIIKLRQLIGTRGKIRGCFQCTYHLSDYEKKGMKIRFFKNMFATKISLVDKHFVWSRYIFEFIE